MGVFALFKNIITFVKDLATKVRNFVSSIFGGRTPYEREEEEEHEADIVPQEHEHQEEGVEISRTQEPRRCIKWRQIAVSVLSVGVITAAKAIKKS